MFHELAHLLRQSSSLCLIDFDDHNDKEEKICNQIAAESLLPENSFTRISNEVNSDNKEWDDISLLDLLTNSQ